MGNKKNKAGKIIGIILGILIVLVIAAGIGFYRFKKTRIDYEGKYGKDTLVYVKDYGFTILLDYNYDKKVNDVNGYAVVNIPFKSFFTNKKVLANDSGYDCADSEEFYLDYCLKAALLDNNFADSLSEALGGNSTRSVQVGKYGNYFIKTANEMGYMPEK